jgi:hypothetical protein
MTRILGKESSEMNDRQEWGPNRPITRLIEEVGRTARSGWPETARFIVLLITAAAAIALVLVAVKS